MSEEERVSSKGLNEIELRIIAELMKNSRRSDRQLAKALHTSQPTVSRIIKRLEKEGIIKEYTMIPNFWKVGYKILALVFVRLKKELDERQTDEARQIATASLRNAYFPIIMLERGLGMDSNGVFVTYHKDYSSYTEFIKWLKHFDFLAIEGVQSFMVDLEDNVRHYPLSFTQMARDIVQMKERKGVEE